MTECQINVCASEFVLGTTDATDFEPILFDLATGVRQELNHEQEDGLITLDFEGIKRVPGRLYEIILRDGCAQVPFVRNGLTIDCIAVEFVSITNAPEND